jgi:hypothetical protein
MKLFQRMAQIADQAREVRESFERFNTRGGGEGRDEDGYRMVGHLSLESSVLFSGLLADVLEGRKPDWVLQEAMSTSDFPELFGDTLNRQLQGSYALWPVTYPNWAQLHDVRDFRDLKLIAVDGGQGLLDKIGEYGPYPETAFTDSKKTVKVEKYGRRYGISLEMVINDDLNAFAQRPQIMADAVRRSEEHLATTQICDVNGPHASFFTAGNLNIITNKLNIAGFQKAFETLWSVKDTHGLPILLDGGVELVIPPSYIVAAQNILNATELRITTGPGGSSGQEIITQNWMREKVRLNVNPLIPYVASSSANNPWFLILRPSTVNRPAIHFAFLRGNRTPQLFVEEGNQIRLGGGPVDPLSGSFNNDSINYKVRHMYGASQGEPKAAVASDDSGS